MNAGLWGLIKWYLWPKVPRKLSKYFYREDAVRIIHCFGITFLRAAKRFTFLFLKKQHKNSCFFVMSDTHMG